MPFVTTGALRKLAPNAKRDIINGIVGPLNKYMPAYGIDTPPRVAHFLAQLAHEAAGLKTMYEYASGAAYEGRSNLGNTHKGDGKRFKGRGLIQITGRYNYTLYGQKLGLDLVNNPDLAADYTNAVRIACEYWKAKNLNLYADHDDVVAISKLINQGSLKAKGDPNGLADRRRYLIKTKALFPAPLPPDVDANKPEPGPAPVKVPKKTTGGVVIATTTAAKSSGMSWEHALMCGVGALIFIVLVFVIINAIRKGDE